jgi:hypothetical protein
MGARQEPEAQHQPGNTLDKSRIKSGKNGKLTDSLGIKIDLRR